MHKETIDKIPAALPGKDSVEVEVYGMEGIPDDAQGSAIFNILTNSRKFLSFRLLLWFFLILTLFVVEESAKKESKNTAAPAPPLIAPFPMLPPGEFIFLIILFHVLSRKIRVDEFQI